jgi:serine/threonine-protein kinase
MLMSLLSSTPASLADALGPATSTPRGLFGYEVVELIGEGAGSLLYAVSDPRSKQIYALKHVVRKTDKDARFIEQLENEYEVGRQVSHANVRRVVDKKLTKSLLLKVTEAALVMELLDGVSLETRLPNNLPALIDVFTETARGLEAMHKSGFVHCDLKPNNIMVTATGRVKVIDLGQAVRVGTAKKRIQGTPDYISPEQVQLKPVTHRTDIFNFGATMYWCLTQRKLPTLYTLKKGDNSLLSDELMAAPHTVKASIPEPLSNLVMECVRTNPLKRPTDMGELISRLEIIRHAAAKQS